MGLRPREDFGLLSVDSRQHDLQQQLELAAEVQRSLLPQKHCCFADWEVAYEYEPAGFVSGDYVDLIPSPDGGVHFVLGDVSGKGLGASMLMSNLHATFRALLGQGLPLDEVLTKTSRAFCEISLPAQFATLVLGTASSDGNIDICNAGHVPVLLSRSEGVTNLSSSALPVGVFCNQSFTSERIKIEKGDVLLLYSDGLSEADSPEGNEYGGANIAALLNSSRTAPITELLTRILQGVHAFAGEKLSDDVSLLALRSV